MPLPMTITSYSSSVSAAVERELSVDASDSGPAETRARETGRRCGTRRRARLGLRELPGLAKRVDAPTEEAARARDAADARAVATCPAAPSAIDGDAAVAITRRMVDFLLADARQPTTVPMRSARDASDVRRGGASL
mmetsp:Transcript_12159/g.50918  ORF Transcript_12159/g.50918 Transcript_12159/m.50918 type:complete len:137 (-) Transcript_12159:96-506(-)